MADSSTRGDGLEAASGKCYPVAEMIARILLVEDNEDLRHLVKEHLEKQRHEVLEASDGAQAFTIAEEEVPHLIITDILMPGVYGTTAIKRLQDFWRTKEIPIIIMSGSIEASMVAELLKHPKVRFLKKPVDMPLLDRTIRELLPQGGYLP